MNLSSLTILLMPGSVLSTPVSRLARLPDSVFWGSGTARPACGGRRAIGLVSLIHQSFLSYRFVFLILTLPHLGHVHDHQVLGICEGWIFGVV